MRRERAWAFASCAAAGPAGAALGVDPAALGAAVLRAALPLGLGHVLESNDRTRQPRRRSIVCRAGSKPRIGTSSGIAGERRRRDQADQLGLDRPGAERRGQLAHPLDDRGRAASPSGSWTLVETWARPLASAQPDRPHAGQAAARLAQAGGDRAGDLDVAAVELDVEGGQRRAGGDQGRAGASGAARPGP